METFNIGELVIIKQMDLTSLPQEVHPFIGQRCVVLSKPIRNNLIKICLFEDFEGYESPSCTLSKSFLERAPKQYVDFSIKPEVDSNSTKAIYTGKFIISFTIDNQTFSLQAVESINHTLWYIKQLKKALKKVK